MAVKMWETILSDLDRGSAASCLVSVDFEKAFKRFSHDSCITALREHNASELTIRLIHVFLKARTMSVRVNETLSHAQSVFGGSP